MQLKRLILTSIAAATLATGMTAYCAGADLMPPEQKQGEVAYLTGGIGEDEARVIEGRAKDYPLTLEFLVKARPRAEFTADVKVMIKDHAGKVVLDTVAQGPFLLVRLPSGKYTIDASRERESKTRHVRLIAKRPTRVIFEWKDAVSQTDETRPTKG